MLVKEVMTKRVKVVKPDTKIATLIEKFKKYKVSGFPVVQGKKVIGIVSESDVLKFMEIHDFGPILILPSPFDVIEAVMNLQAELFEIEHDLEILHKGTVSGIMSKKVHSIHSDDHISKAADVMLMRRVNRLPVVDKHHNLVGILTRIDLMKALL